MKKLLFFVLVIFAFALMPMIVPAETGPNPVDVPRMTKEELKAKPGSPDLVIIDVRTSHDWQDSDAKIKGAVREELNRLGSWIDKYPKEKTIVLYCK